MARIKRDPDDWKARGIKKRDFNHAHDEPEVPRKTGKSKKKNTKRWCRGKEGREHVVVDRTPPRMPDFSCCSPEKQKHYMWMHRREVKCINCGMDSWRLPDEARAQVEPRLKRMLDAEKKWCDEGHLYDKEENFKKPPLAFQGDLRFSNNWKDNLDFAWSSRYWEHEICVMCGKRGKTRRRN